MCQARASRHRLAIYFHWLWLQHQLNWIVIYSRRFWDSNFTFRAFTMRHHNTYTFLWRNCSRWRSLCIRRGWSEVWHLHRRLWPGWHLDQIQSRCRAHWLQHKCSCFNCFRRSWSQIHWPMSQSILVLVDFLDWSISLWLRRCQPWFRARKVLDHSFSVRDYLCLHSSQQSRWHDIRFGVRRFQSRRDFRQFWNRWSAQVQDNSIATRLYWSEYGSWCIHNINYWHCDDFKSNESCFNHSDFDWSMFPAYSVFADISCACRSIIHCEWLIFANLHTPWLCGFALNLCGYVYLHNLRFVEQWISYFPKWKDIHFCVQ